MQWPPSDPQGGCFPAHLHPNSMSSTETQIDESDGKASALSSINRIADWFASIRKVLVLFGRSHRSMVHTMLLCLDLSE